MHVLTSLYLHQHSPRLPLTLDQTNVNTSQLMFLCPVLVHSIKKPNLTMPFPCFQKPRVAPFVPKQRPKSGSCSAYPSTPSSCFLTSGKTSKHLSQKRPLQVAAIVAGSPLKQAPEKHPLCLKRDKDSGDQCFPNYPWSGASFFGLCFWILFLYEENKVSFVHSPFLLGTGYHEFLSLLFFRESTAD